jgi:hypothetical protein
LVQSARSMGFRIYMFAWLMLDFARITDMILEMVFLIIFGGELFADLYSGLANFDEDTFTQTLYQYSVLVALTFPVIYTVMHGLKVKHALKDVTIYFPVVEEEEKKEQPLEKPKEEKEQNIDIELQSSGERNTIMDRPRKTGMLEESPILQPPPAIKKVEEKKPEKPEKRTSCSRVAWCISLHIGYVVGTAIFFRVMSIVSVISDALHMSCGYLHLEKEPREFEEKTFNRLVIEQGATIIDNLCFSIPLTVFICVYFFLLQDQTLIPQELLIAKVASTVCTVTALGFLFQSFPRLSEKVVMLDVKELLYQFFCCVSKKDLEEADMYQQVN